MEEFDLEVVIQRALEKYPNVRPCIISDNSSQFISWDFKCFLGEKELKQVRPSIRYPQINGKIENFHKTINKECICKKNFLDILNTREIIEKYIEEYNCRRLHSGIYYLPPKDLLEKKKRLKE